jgi:ABC-type multidrug transport system fused ATPase/permease subunit
MHLLKHFDRILVLENGTIAAQGTLRELFDAYPEMMSRITGLNNTNNQLFASSEGSGKDTVDDVSDSNKSLHIDHQQPDNEEALSMVNVDVAVEDVIYPPTTVEEKSSKDSAQKESADSKESVKGKVLIQAEKVDNDSFAAVMAYIKYFSAALVPSRYIYESRFYPLVHGSYQPPLTVENENDLQVAKVNKPSIIAKSESFLTTGLLIQGFLMLVFALFIYNLTQGFRVAVDYYFAYYSQRYPDHKYEIVYYCMFGGLIFAAIVRSVLLGCIAVKSSQTLHASVLRHVLSAPIPTFFDTNTIGSILNRFSKDMETVDVSIPDYIMQFLVNLLQVLSVFVLCIYSAPWFALVLIPLGMIFVHVYRYFAKGSKELKRLESVTRSPIYSMLSETLNGLETIRAYGDNKRFLHAFIQRMKRNQKLLFHFNICTAWMTARLEITTAIILLSISLIAVGVRESVSPIFLGLALSFGLQLTAMFQRTVQVIIDLGNYMTSTERVLEYLTIPQEVNYHIPVAEAGSSVRSGAGSVRKEQEQALLEWQPKSGKIVLENVWMQYRDNPAVLRGLTVSISGGQRVGVCGRTGAGKVSVLTTNNVSISLELLSSCFVD